MKDATSHARETLNACCDRFEADWDANQPPRIEDYLPDTDEPDRAERLRALVALECELRRRDGLPCKPNLFMIRFPKDAMLIADVFKSLTKQQLERSTRATASNEGSESTQVGDNGPKAKRITSVEVPTHIGRYEIRALLGEGAFGYVYRAHDPKLQRDVALKVPKAGAVTSPMDRERFFREARAAASLRHPNICTIYEVHDDSDPPFLVMDFIAGKSFDTYLRQLPAPMPERQSAAIVCRLALALAVAHDKGIIHRDLKPSNILVDQERKDVILTDFGLARRVQPGETSLTADGMVLGTPAYMSPEQARGDTRLVTPASDIFSLGVIFYELLAGVRPFQGAAIDVLLKVRVEDPLPPSQVRASVDPLLEAICLKAMAKNAQDRYQSMKELAQALQAYLRKTPANAATPGTNSPMPNA